MSYLPIDNRVIFNTRNIKKHSVSLVSLIGSLNRTPDKYLLHLSKQQALAHSIHFFYRLFPTLIGIIA